MTAIRQQADTEKKPSFQDVADQKEHRGLRSDDSIFDHTVHPAAAGRLVRGYLQFLRKILNFSIPENNTCMDLGCGAGYITKEFQRYGFNIKCLEKSDDALDAVKRHNPDLHVTRGDITAFRVPETYDFIFSREVYCITRINDFAEQLKIISNIVDSLRSGGVFMLVASDVSFPQCADYDRIIKTMRKDKRMKSVTKKHYEVLFRRFPRFIRGPFSYEIIERLLRPVIYFFIKRRDKASIYMIGFVKN